MLSIKKAITMVLLCILILTAFAGCSENVKSSGQENQTTGVKIAKLHILGPGGTDKYLKVEDREKYPVWKEIKKLFDDAGLELELEIVPFEQYGVTIKTRMASSSNLPDIANLSALDNTTVLNLAKQGIILDVNGLVDKYSNGNIKNMYTTQFPYAKQLTTSSDGKMYWFSDLHKKTYKEIQPAPVSRTMLIRKDWLDKLGLPVPTTAQEYFDTLKAFRDRDANGNNQADEILQYDPTTFTEAIAQWFGLGTAISSVDVENKKVVTPWYQPGIKEYFKFLQQLVKAGIIDTSLIGAGYEQKQQKLTENKVASLTDYNLEAYLEPTINGGGEYLPLMPLKAVDAITPAAQLEPPFLVWQKYAITKNCKDLKAAIAFFDVIYSEKYADLGFWGIEGKTYQKDSNGAKLFINNVSNEEKAKSGNAPFYSFAGDTVFPRIQFANLEYELTRVSKGKVDHELQILNYKTYYVNMNDNYLSIPDDKQLEEKTKLLNDLSTYTTELSAKLALGQKSLDNWDQYIADLKKLGLDRLIEIDQQLFDRYNSLK